MNHTAITVKDVHIKYKGLKPVSIKKSFFKFKKTNLDVYHAVKGVSFEIEQGKILGIIGKNGSGKSTLLKAIAGIFSPDEGFIDLHGNTVSLLSIGVGFQNEMTGYQNIFLSGLLLGFNREQIKSHLNEIIEFSELKEFINKPVKTYSSGMYSKLAFSITAIMETDILLIDEVLSVGDIAFKEKSYKRMQELIQDEKRTVVMVSHSIDALSKLCDEIIWMHNGKIKQKGNPDLILAEYQKFMLKK